MARKMIGFDLDGVLYNWHMAVYEFLNNTGVETGTYNEFWTEGHHMFDGTPYKGYRSIKWHNLCTNTILFDRPEHFTKSVPFLQELAKNCDLIYITARVPEVERVTKRTLKKYEFPNPTEVIFASDKTVPVILNNVEIFVEDQVGNALELKTLCKVLIMNQVWNTEIHSEFDVINALQEIENYL